MIEIFHISLGVFIGVSCFVGVAWLIEKFNEYNKKKARAK